MAFSANFRSWRTVAMATLLTGTMYPGETANSGSENLTSEKAIAKVEKRTETAKSKRNPLV